MDKENLTQVGRGLQHLGMELIPAYSPEARGRSERMFGTFQKRLPQELRSRGITTMEDASRFLKEVYLPDHNARFVKVPEDEASAFVPFTGNARDTLCVREDRVVGNDNTVRYKGLVLQVAANRHRHHFVKAKVRVHDYPDGELAIFHGPRCIGRHQSDGSPIKQEESKQKAA